jgi:large subunit ribosomal protein L6e
MFLAGPFKVNGVPLRCVNQVYVIATSTKVDVSKADVSKISDDFFKKAKKAVKKGESEFFTEDKEVSAATQLGPSLALDRMRGTRCSLYLSFKRPMIQ